MKNENNKVLKMVSELMGFCYRISSHKFNMDVDNFENKTILTLVAYVNNLDTTTLDKAKDLLTSPRLHELEEYYWNLPGDDLYTSELNLVGMMCDKADIKYEDNKFLTITLIRYR
ncbi:hypothetical protein [Clostridium rectalis]|uniref:hypothetical protein n=1 Tax=Clostridium rectalis TaxID=2040295 RepID=UPI000F63A4DE|nr:hypothetical protein [Clostridium rectalis]